MSQHVRPSGEFPAPVSRRARSIAVEGEMFLLLPSAASDVSVSSPPTRCRRASPIVSPTDRAVPFRSQAMNMTAAAAPATRAAHARR